MMVVKYALKINAIINFNMDVIEVAYRLEKYLYLNVARIVEDYLYNGISFNDIDNLRKKVESLDRYVNDIDYSLYDTKERLTYMEKSAIAVNDACKRVKTIDDDDTAELKNTIICFAEKINDICHKYNKLIHVLRRKEAKRCDKWCHDDEFELIVNDSLIDEDEDDTNISVSAFNIIKEPDYN